LENNVLQLYTPHYYYFWDDFLKFFSAIFFKPFLRNKIDHMPLILAYIYRFFFIPHTMYRLQAENCPFCEKKELFEWDQEMLFDTVFHYELLYAFWVEICLSSLNCISMVVCWKSLERYHPLFFSCLLLLEMLEKIQIYNELPAAVQ
jgi:hypothetical protein